MYKKITAEADKQVRIKKHPLKRTTIPTNIFFEEEKEQSNPITEPENKPETRKSTRILEKKENKNVYKKEEKEEKKPTLRIVKKIKHTTIEEEIENILKEMEKRKITTKNYRYKVMLDNINLIRII